MTIIVVNDYAYVNGGAGQVALSSAAALAGLGHKVVLFTAVGPVSPDLQTCPNLEVICLQQYDILSNPSRLGAVVSGVWNRTAAREFARLLQRFDPAETVVHIHTCSKALSTSIIAKAADLHFKTIFHLHDYALACPNMGFFNFPRQSICSLKPLGLQCCVTNCDKRSYLHKGWRMIRQLAQRGPGGLPRRIDCFLSVSDFCYAVLQPYLPDNARVAHIRNPVNVEKTERVMAENNRTFVFVGRLEPEKNPLILARVAKALDVPVIFVGDGPCRQNILDICPQALVTGWLDREKVYAYLNTARALVLPSNWYEAQGLVASEAAARGVPVLVSDACAAREFMREGITGFLFNTQKEDDLMGKMLLMQDDQRAQAMSAAAFEHYWQHPMDMAQYQEAVLALYSELLS